jgi:hypothetical protein
LTIVEMLEILETEILSLRARNLQLQTSLTQGHRNGEESVAGNRSRRAAKKKSRGKKKAGASSQKPKRGDTQQLELTAQENLPATEAPVRTLGKRQALGKSLLQLRKMSATRPQQAP